MKHVQYVTKSIPVKAAGTPGGQFLLDLKTFVQSHSDVFQQLFQKGASQ